VRTRPNALLLLGFVIALAAAAPEGAPTGGRVNHVADGDSFVLEIAGGSEMRVRLGEIDAPERGQPFASRARSALAGLVEGKTVRLVPQDVDRYDRLVARVYVGDVDVSAELVSRGLVWVYAKYAKDEHLFALELEARAARRGLWSLPESERVPPWRWRHAESREGAGDEPRAFTCGAKTYCREMTSCAEARFYLETCGLTRLDGDGDGKPCSGLCR